MEEGKLNKIEDKIRDRYIYKKNNEILQLQANDILKDQNPQNKEIEKQIYVGLKKLKMVPKIKVTGVQQHSKRPAHPVILL